MLTFDLETRTAADPDPRRSHLSGVERGPEPGLRVVGVLYHGSTILPTEDNVYALREAADFLEALTKGIKP